MSFWDEIKKVFYSEFFKYSAALLSSNVIAQLIGFVIYPFITRIYTPEIFGEFTFFVNIASIAVLVSTGRYELAILLPASEKKVAALFQLTLIINLSFFVLSFLPILIWREEIAFWVGHEGLVSLLLLLPFLILLRALWLPLNNLFIRKKKYYNISAYNLMQSSIGAGLKCFLGIKGFMASGLIWGQFSGQFLATATGLIAGRASLKNLTHIDKSEIWQVAKIYSNFPKFQLPQTLLNAFAGNLPVLLLSFYFDMKEIGLFALALTIGLNPVFLFSNSAYQILFRKISEQVRNKQKLLQNCLLFCKICVIFILPFFILFFFMPESFFVMLFGIKWIGVGSYLKWMLPWLFLVILNASLGFIPDLFFRQKTAMHIEIIYFVIRLIALLLGIYFHNFGLAVHLYCGVSALMMAVKVIWYFRLIKKYESFL